MMRKRAGSSSQRGSSGSRQSSSLLENEAQKMEDKLNQLKKAMDKEKNAKENIMRASGSRWKTPSQKEDEKKSISTKGEGDKSFISACESEKESAEQKLISKKSTSSVTANTSSSRIPRVPSANSRTRSNTGTSIKIGKENIVNIDNQKKIGNTRVNTVKGSAKTPSAAVGISVSSNVPAVKRGNESEKDEGQFEQLDSFLSSVGLEQYKERFKQHGFDDLETILELNGDHMNEMEIPMGHQIKIRKRIEKAKEETDGSEKVKAAFVMPERRTDLIELEAPEQNEFSCGVYETKAKATISGGVGTDAGNDLLDGVFDEKESHQSFLEALMEFRNQGKPAEVHQKVPVVVAAQRTSSSSTSTGTTVNQKSTPERSSLHSSQSNSRRKSVRFAESTGDEKSDETGNAEGEFERLFSKMTDFLMGSSHKQPASLGQQTNQSGTNDRGFSVNNGISSSNSKSQLDGSTKSAGKTWCCYNCFKRIGEEENIVEFEKKRLCGEECLSAYKDQISAECSKCGAIVLKAAAVFENACWYCSEKCERLGQTKQSREKSVGNHQETESPSKEGLSEHAEEEEGENGMSSEEFDLDLNFDSNDDKILSLDALESKYKSLRQV